MILRPLSREHGARFESGTYDLRQWEIRLHPSDTRVGFVDDVLLDERGRTRYLDVALDSDRRHVLVPSGHAEADERERLVRVSGIGEDDLSRIPEYAHDPALVDRDYESRLEYAYATGAAGYYYERPDFRASWGRGKNTTSSGRLARLDRLDDIDVAKGDPDPRGWEVVGCDGARLGKVHHLVGDLDAMKVRYLTMRVDEEIATGRREVLVPVGHVDLDPGGKQVRTALDRRRALELPAYDGGEISREHEDALMASLSTVYSEDLRYEHPRYRYHRLYGREGTGQVDPLVPGATVVRRWRFRTGAGTGDEVGSQTGTSREGQGRRR